MKRLGRKRKNAARELNGKPKRPTLQQIAEIERHSREHEMAVVLAQPHRRGERDQKAASALGRFVLQQKLKEEVYDAGEEYAALVRRWRVAKGVPVQGRVGPSTGMPLDDATVDTWGKRIASIERRFLKAGPGVASATIWLTIDDRDLASPSWPLALVGLRALADELGLLKEDQHPFNRA